MSNPILYLIVIAILNAVLKNIGKSKEDKNKRDREPLRQEPNQKNIKVVRKEAEGGKKTNSFETFNVDEYLKDFNRENRTKENTAREDKAKNDKIKDYYDEATGKKEEVSKKKVAPIEDGSRTKSSKISRENKLKKEVVRGLIFSEILNEPKGIKNMRE